jgi:hypothetical protein
MMPEFFLSSVSTGVWKEEILKYIEYWLNN